MKLKIQITVLALALITLASIANAQSCFVAYSPSDRQIVKKLSLIAGENLSRMHEIAWLLTVANFSLPQRSAFEAEFQALKDQITQIGDRGDLAATPRTNVFLNKVIDASFLGLDQSTNSGASIAEGQANSHLADRSIYLGLKQLSSCL